MRRRENTKTGASPRGTRSLEALLTAAILAVAACGGSDSADSTEATTTVDASATTSTVAAATTTITTTTTSTTTTTVETTTTTVAPTTTAEPAPTTTGPVAACQAYVGELGEVLQATADQLADGAAVVGQLADGTLPESEGAAQLTAISDEFAALTDRLFELGEPPPEAVPALALVGESLVLFESAADLQAQGAATGDAALIDQGTAALDAGAALLVQVPDALPDCSDAPGDGGDGTRPGQLATPDEFDLTVFFRLAESIFSSTDSPYIDTPPEVLTQSAQAACRVLLAGGDIRTAIDAAIAASPITGQPFGAAEQQYVLLVVTRGADLWCPSVVIDRDVFAAEVITTITDIFFEG